MTTQEWTLSQLALISVALCLGSNRRADLTRNVKSSTGLHCSLDQTRLNSSICFFLAMAGNIIPAIAATNAIVAGLIVMTAFKVLLGNLHECHTVSP